MEVPSVLWKTLNRTILLELLKIFLLALVSITGLLLLAVVVKEAQNQGLGPLQILAIIPLVIPSTLPYTIPTTTLFATCVVYGRLAHDNEITAIKAAGISVSKVIWPALFLGLVMSVLTAALYYSVIPTSFHLMKTVFLKDMEKMLYTVLKEQGEFSHPKVDYVIHVKKVKGRKLMDALFMHRESQGGYDIIARAREAELLVNMAQKKILVHMRHCYITNKNGETAYVEDKVWPVDFPPNFNINDRKLRRSDMTWKELFARLDDLEEEKKETEADIALEAARVSLSDTPDSLAIHLKNLRNLRHFQLQQIRDVHSEIQRRPALAFGCFCFVLVGCPVGIWFSKSDYLSAFVTCFLPIILIYYPLILCGENLARAGTFHPAIAVWAANIQMGIIAFFLYK